MKVLHVPCYSPSDPLPVLRGYLSEIEYYRSVGLVATAQHLDRLDEIAGFLRGKGKKVLVGGQILGCNQKNALYLQGKVDCFLYVGSGRFHPIGLALKTKKPVFLLNPISKVFDHIRDDEKRMWERRQKARIMKAASAETFGVLVSTKDGQYNLKKAEEIKKRLEACGKKAYIFAGEELSPSNLLPFKVDCWVNTACPRLVDDEHRKPVLNLEELAHLFSI